MSYQRREECKGSSYTGHGGCIAGDDCDGGDSKY